MPIELVLPICMVVFLCGVFLGFCIGAGNDIRKSG